MSNVLSLVKIHYMGAFGLNRALHSKDSKERYKFWGIGALIAFSFLILFGTCFMYCWGIGSSLKMLGMQNILISIMMAVSSSICLFTSIYKGSSVLFNCSDYDLIMPLPMKSTHVVAAKLIILYLMNLTFTLFVMIPAAVVYGILAAPAPLYYFFVILLSLLIPLLPIIIGTAFSVLISMIAARFRSKNIVSILLSILFVFAVMVFSFSSGSMTEEMLTDVSVAMMESVYKIYPLTRMFTEAVCSQNILSALFFVAISTVVFGAFVYFVGTKFKAMHTFLTTSKSRSNYKMGALQYSSPFAALYKKEMKRYFASTIYVMNTIVGALMLTIMSIVLLVSGEDMLSQMIGIPGVLTMSGYVIPFIISTLMGMTSTTSVSISLEGKTFSLLKTLPVTSMQIYYAKIMVNLTITIPAILINVPILSYVLKLSAFQTVMCFIITLAFTLLWSQFGIIINLLLPNFTWVNEISVVKNSMNTFICIFGGMLLALVPLIPLFAINISKDIMLVVIALLFVLGDVLVYSVLKNWGTKAFNKLT